MITLLTCTYNRRHTLDRLWQSLCAMVRSEPFEWVLVDDGSQDGTADWWRTLPDVDGIQKVLRQQANQGKPRAVNTGVQAASGDWILLVDSDDLLPPDALQHMARAIARHGQDPALQGLCFRKADLQGRLLGRRPSGPSPRRMSPNQAGACLQADLAYLFRRSAMLQVPMAWIEGEKFVPELYTWNAIADRGPILYDLDTVIYWCEYLPDGYTANFARDLRANPRGFGLFYRDQLRRLRQPLPWIKALIRTLQCAWWARRLP